MTTCTKRKSIVSFFPKSLYRFPNITRKIAGLIITEIDSILQGLRSTTEISEILMFAAWFHIFHETEKVPRFLIAWATIQRNIFLSAELMPSK